MKVKEAKDAKEVTKEVDIKKEEENENDVKKKPEPEKRREGAALSPRPCL
jgi:hypothetical protein